MTLARPSSQLEGNRLPEPVVETLDNDDDSCEHKR